MTKLANKPVARIVIADDKAIKPTPIATLKGSNAALRNTALQGVAMLAFTEGKARGETIASLRIILGNKPTPAALSAAQLEYTIGRMAFKLPTTLKDDAARIAHARKLITQYAAPVKDGVKAKDLRKGQLGRRSVAEQKLMRAADSAWSLVKAEMGFGTAVTQAEKNKRAANRKAPAAPVAPSHGELVAAPKVAADKAEACAMVANLANTLLGYVNKNAALLPVEYGQSVKRFHGAIMQLEKDRAKNADIAKDIANV